jgi:hypothetical protein
MAFRATLVFGGFIFDQFAFFIINVMAFGAGFDLGQFIMLIMVENCRWSPRIFKGVSTDKAHVFLAIRGTPKNDANDSETHQDQDKFLHAINSFGSSRSFYVFVYLIVFGIAT